MELQFHKSLCICQNPIVCDIRSQEQTQEVKLSEGMPDVGRILASWGQCLLRSKEWRSDSMGITGGVMTWTLYMPEDGYQPVCVETWVPFHMKWDLPPTQRDGAIRTACFLQNVDARTLSARRILVRTNVSVWAEAMEEVNREIMKPGEMPGDVQLLRQTYPVLIPKEVGEKTFVLEDELQVSSSWGKPEKILSYQLKPEVVDKKVIGQRLVFRGNGLLHVVFQSEDGTIHNCNLEVPFSQLAELDSDYETEGEPDVLPAVTSLELDLLDGKLQLKCGIAVQYLIRKRELVEIVRDAYSPRRSVEPDMTELNMPIVLDQRMENPQLDLEISADVEEFADSTVFLDHPRQIREEDKTDLLLNGNIQILYYDHENHLQCVLRRFEEKIEIPVSCDAEVQACFSDSEAVQVNVSGADIHARLNIPLEITTVSDSRIPMVSGLSAGEQEEPDPIRPSLILRKAGEEPLWEVAKQCGTTVDAIRTANKLLSEPEYGQILLIPIP